MEFDVVYLCFNSIWGSLEFTLRFLLDNHRIWELGRDRCSHEFPFNFMCVYVSEYMYVYHMCTGTGGGQMGPELQLDVSQSFWVVEGSAVLRPWYKAQ